MFVLCWIILIWFIFTEFRLNVQISTKFTIHHYKWCSHRLLGASVYGFSMSVFLFALKVRIIPQLILILLRFMRLFVVAIKLKTYLYLSVYVFLLHSKYLFSTYNFLKKVDICSLLYFFFELELITKRPDGVLWILLYFLMSGI